MLPEILEIAQRNQLYLNNRTMGKKEVLSKCPFCSEDTKSHKKHKFYLSLNTEDQVFRCWYCNESGGVLRFISLLEGESEQKITAKFRKKKVIHPAETLTSHQRKLIMEFFNYTSGPDLFQMKRRDKGYYLRTLDQMWKDWQSFLELEKRRAYQTLVSGIILGKYSSAIKEIKKREKEIGASFLDEILTIYSCAKRPKWTESAEKFVNEILKNPIRPEPVSAGRDKE